MAKLSLEKNTPPKIIDIYVKPELKTFGLRIKSVIAQPITPIPSVENIVAITSKINIKACLYECSSKLKNKKATK